MRKNVCFWYIFGCWIHICFQNFSITHTFHAASDYVKTQAYICESLGACSRYSGHVVSDVIHMWLTVLCQLLARAQCVVVSEVHSVCFTINMPGKCVNSMDAFCYICRGEGWHSNPEDGLSQPWLRNAMSIISAAKWVIRTRVGLPIFVVWLAQAKGSCVPFTIMVWREPTHHVSDCYFCLTCITGVTAKSKHCSISKFTICDEASTLQCGVTLCQSLQQTWR